MTEILWNQASEAEWRDILSACGKSSLEQSWGYGVASERNRFTVERGVVVDTDRRIGLVQAFTRRFLGVATVTQIVRGPLWVAGVDHAAKQPILIHLRKRYAGVRLRFLYWTPELLEGSDARGAMRQTGSRRVVTGYHSAWIDLSADEDRLRAAMTARWRSKLRAAEGAGLSIRLSHGGQDLDSLLEHADGYRRKRRYRGPDGKFIQAVAEGTGVREDVMVVSAYRAKALLAAALVIRHGQSATYYAGWSGPEGRAVSAQNAVLWRAMQTLKKREVRWFDLGGIDTTTAAGVARFKLGMGGEVFTLAGGYQ